MKYLGSLILLTLSVGVWAQTPADSIYSSKPTDSVYRYRSTQNLLKAIDLSMPQLLNHEVEKSTKVGLEYNYIKGGFRQAQQAELDRTAKFAAEGISTLDRFKLYGSFEFHRNWQDSLAFSQKGIEDRFSPYYFIAQKAGVFERQTYKGKGLVAYELIPKKWYLGTAIDYLYHTSNRSVDPRSSVTTYQFKVIPQITYSTGAHNIGVGLRYGYGDETVGIAYKNDDFQGTLLFPDRISYLNFGYGYLEINQTNFRRKFNSSGFELNYAGMLADWNTTTKLSYSIDKTENLYETSNSIRDNVFGDFQLETVSADVQLYKKLSITSHLIGLHFDQQVGDDNLRRLAARNFTYEASNLNLDYVLAKYNALDQVAHEYNFQLMYHSTYQRDAAANHTLEFSYLQPQLGFSKYWKSGFIGSLDLGARIPLNNDVRVPFTQENLFTKGVVYPDYMYWASQVGMVQVAVKYRTDKLIPKFNSELAFQTAYLSNLSSPEVNFVPTFVPAKQRLNLNIGFNLYF